MDQKNYFRAVVSTAAALLAGSIALNWYVDPFFYFHLPRYQVTSLNEDYPLHQIYNAAERFQYDSVIVGTSTSVNFMPDWLKDDGQNAIQLSVPGSCPKDIYHILDSAFSSGNQIKTVYYGVDLFMLGTDYRFSNFSYHGLLDENAVVAQMHYMLNKEILIRSVSCSLTDREETLEHYNLAFAHTNGDSPGTKYGKEEILKRYVRPEYSDQSSAVDAEVENALQNAKIILEYARENPETQFYIYLMPVSMFWWDYTVRTNESEYVLSGVYSFFSALADTGNVSLYCFADNYEMSADNQYYRDWTHHSSKLDYEILSCLRSGTGIITSANLAQRMDALKELVSTFDYKSLFH